MISKVEDVTTEDYKIYVKKLFPNTKTVSVWGGEDGSYDVSTGVSGTDQSMEKFLYLLSQDQDKI